MSGTGVISNAQDIWKQMLEACDAVTDGGWGIHHDRLPLPTAYADEYDETDLATYLPFGIVWSDPSSGFEYEFVGEPATWEPSGTVVVEFYRKAPVPPDDMTFRDFVGTLIQQLAQLSNTPGNIVLKSMRVLGPVVSIPEEYPEFGPLQTMMVIAKWS